MFGAITYSAVDLYSHYESNCRSKINRVCIDGRVTGCGNCVGYCQFDGHPGFLTEKQRKAHNCIGKGCFYYVARPVKAKPVAERTDIAEQLLALAKEATAFMEGLMVLTAVRLGAQRWQLNYITISNMYPIQNVADSLSLLLDCEIHFERLNYSFDNCVKLIMAD